MYIPKLNFALLLPNVDPGVTVSTLSLHYLKLLRNNLSNCICLKLYMLEQVLSLSIPMLKFASLLGLRIMSLPEPSPSLNNLEYSLYKNAFL